MRTVWLISGGRVDNTTTARLGRRIYRYAVGNLSRTDITSPRTSTLHSYDGSVRKNPQAVKKRRMDRA